MRLPQFARDARSALFEALAYRRWSRLRPERPGKPHGLPGELIVSLTSFPPRFETLALTLVCLCDQTVRADRIILWIANEHIEQLPRDVRWYMRAAGVDIHRCDNMGPYKKLIPALEQFPDAYIVTADDDLHYRRDWLEALVTGFDGRSIACHWGHLAPNGAPDWKRLAKAGQPVLPGSGAGVLYPPGSLSPDVTDRRFLSVCPTGDDLWYFHHARVPVRKVGPKFRLINWIGTQDSALANENLAGGNERMFARLTEA